MSNIISKESLEKLQKLKEKLEISGNKELIKEIETKLETPSVEKI